MGASVARRAGRKANPLGIPDHAIWGSELSPFALKLRAICDFAGIEYAWLPADGSRLRNYRALWTINRAKRGRTAIRGMSSTGSVPFSTACYSSDSVCLM